MYIILCIVFTTNKQNTGDTNMGREIRRVPKDWVHPKNEYGNYDPLLDGNDFKPWHDEWLEGSEKWDGGFMNGYTPEAKWVVKSTEYEHMSYEDYVGSEPDISHYMPDWPTDICTHMMMYETCTEGTPISPAFITCEELARWLTDNEASSFGTRTASYEQWLDMCQRGWAMSAVVDETGGLVSGVEYSPERVKED